MKSCLSQSVALLASFLLSGGQTLSKPEAEGAVPALRPILEVIRNDGEAFVANGMENKPCRPAKAEFKWKDLDNMTNVNPPPFDLIVVRSVAQSTWSAILDPSYGDVPGHPLRLVPELPRPDRLRELQDMKQARDYLGNFPDQQERTICGFASIRGGNIQCSYVVLYFDGKRRITRRILGMSDRLIEIE